MKKLWGKTSRLVTIFICILSMVCNYLIPLDSVYAQGYEAKNVLGRKESLTSKYISQNDFKLIDNGKIYKSPAFDFHIFAKEATLGVHTNGNVAVDNLIANTNFGTHMSNYKGKREDNYISTSASGINGIASKGNIVVGNGVEIRKEDNGNKVVVGSGSNSLDNEISKNVYREENYEKYINIGEELNNLKIISEKLSYIQTNPNVILNSPSGENQLIEVKEPGYNNYLNIHANDISSGNNKRVLKITIPSETTLIINVDMKGVSKDQLANITVSINGKANSESLISEECGVLWNLYDSSNSNRQFVTTDMAEVGTADVFMGTILAPSASIKYGALNGTIIAQKVANIGRESHRWDFTGHEYDEEEKETSVNLEGKKTLTGKDLEKGMFKFQVLDKDGKEVSTGTNDENGKIEFSKINYEKAGNYEYTVKEVVGNEPGVSYDATEYKVTVEVKDVNGELKAEVSYPNGKPEFENKYSAKATNLSLEGKKTLIGKDLKEGMFKFQVLDEFGKEVSTGTNDENGKIIFEEIKYTKAGSHEYTVKEVAGNEPGVSYDTTEYKMTVEVKDVNGELKVEVSYPNGKPEFENKYSAKATSVNLLGNKTLTGKDLEKGMFKFQVLDEFGKEVSTGTNDENGKIIFEEIRYTKVGNYEYTVKEVVGNEPGISYDDTEYKVTVKVTDEKGKLKAEVSYPNGKPEFENKYSAKATSVNLEGHKTLTGKDLEEGMFKFQVIDESGEEVSTGTNDKTGKIKFSKINYEKVGSYEYTVKEVAGNEPGVSYDDTEYKVTVEVKDVNGELKAEVSYPNGKPEFENKYSAKATSVNLVGNKTLTGKDLEEGMFKFQVVDGKNEVMSTGTNDENGKIEFSKINYEKAGIYEYTVKEVAGNEPGISYDDTEYKVIVKVDDVKGELKAEVSYPESGVKFTNKYSAKATSVRLEGNKTLIGKDLKEGMFKFQVLDELGKEVSTGTNDENGKIIFEEIKYTKAGSHEYTVKEVVGNEPGVSYDDTEYKVTVKVDDINGELKAEVSYPESGVKFENKYSAKEISVNLEGNKTLTGKDLKEGMFRFQVLDEFGKEVSTGTNDENGKITFEEIRYTKVGNYEYTVKEVAGNEPGISYDTTEYKVTVKVEDVNGELKAEISYINGKPEFENKYSAKETSVILEGKKTLTGKDLEKGMFKFQVLDKDGKEVSTGMNDENGKITFEEIKYTKVGNYEYTVKEVVGNEPGVSYDATEYKVIVNVEDDNGQLNANIDYVDGTIEFNNIYNNNINDEDGEDDKDDDNVKDEEDKEDDNVNDVEEEDKEDDNVNDVEEEDKEDDNVNDEEEDKEDDNVNDGEEEDKEDDNVNDSEEEDKEDDNVNDSEEEDKEEDKEDDNVNDGEEEDKEDDNVNDGEEEDKEDDSEEEDKEDDNVNDEEEDKEDDKENDEEEDDKENDNMNDNETDIKDQTSPSTGEKGIMSYVTICISALATLLFINRKKLKN